MLSDGDPAWCVQAFLPLFDRFDANVAAAVSPPLHTAWPLLASEPCTVRAYSHAGAYALLKPGNHLRRGPGPYSLPQDIALSTAALLDPFMHHATKRAYSCLQAGSNGAIDPGIIVPAQKGEELDATLRYKPVYSSNLTNPLGVNDLVKDILNGQNDKNKPGDGGLHLFQSQSGAPPPDGKDDQGFDLPAGRQHAQGRLGRL